MKAVFALCAALLGTTSAAHAAPPHYDVAAHFDPDGLLAADVTITLSEGDREKAFLLSDRFALQPMALPDGVTMTRSEEHTSELQSLMRISYAVFCLKKKT